MPCTIPVEQAALSMVKSKNLSLFPTKKNSIYITIDIYVCGKEVLCVNTIQFEPCQRDYRTLVMTCNFLANFRRSIKKTLQLYMML